MTTTLNDLINRLASELEPLLESGENWQLSLHGGRGGDVVMKVERTRQLRKPQSEPPDNIRR